MRTPSEIKKIIQINISDVGGGAEDVSWNLFNEYQKRSFDSWLYVGRKRTVNPHIIEIPNDFSHGIISKVMIQPSILLEKIFGQFRGCDLFRTFLQYLSNPIRIRYFFKGQQYYDFPGIYTLVSKLDNSSTIIHCHNLHGNYFDLRILPQLSSRFPVILHLHDEWIFTGFCACSLQCNELKSDCKNCPLLSSKLFVKKNIAQKNLVEKIDILNNSKIFIVTPSFFLLNKVKETGIKAIEYRVIPNGVNLKIFKPTDKNFVRNYLNLPLNSFILLSVAGNLKNNPYKDYSTMEKAIEHLPYPVIFICLGSRGKRKTIGKSSIIFIPFERDANKVAMYYQSSDIYIHAAHCESFCKTITEAFACGLPVVATRIGGIPEQVIDGYNGFLVDEGDHEKMKSCIERLIENSKIRYEMGNNAYLTAIQKYNLEKQVVEFINWYHEILADK